MIELLTKIISPSIKYMHFGSTISPVNVYKVPFGYILQPIEPCYKAQFEYLFDFGCGNMRFTTDKFVFRKNPYFVNPLVNH